MTESPVLADRQYVVFGLGPESYGLDIARVREIITLQQITEVPRTQEFVEGIINLRGRVIPVFNLRKRFGMPEHEATRSTRIVVVEANGNILGVIVDSVSEVQQINGETVEPPSPVIVDLDTQYISGVAKMNDRLIILLDLDLVLAGDNIS